MAASVKKKVKSIHHWEKKYTVFECIKNLYVSYKSIHTNVEMIQIQFEFNSNTNMEMLNLEWLI